MGQKKVHGPELRKGPISRMTWNAFSCEEIGPKHKDNKLLMVGREVLPHAKKFKKEKKSVAQSNVVITHLGSTEVAEPPRQVQ